MILMQNNSLQTLESRSGVQDHKNMKNVDFEKVLKHKYENKRISHERNKEQGPITHNHHVYELQSLKDEKKSRIRRKQRKERRKTYIFVEKWVDNPQILFE